MKKLFGITLSLLVAGLVLAAANAKSAKAEDQEYIYGDSEVANSDFSLGSGSPEVAIGTVSQNGWGDWDDDGNEVVTVSPTDPSNHVLKMKQGGFYDFFGLADFEAGTYKVSFDYYFVGTCDNIGFHFYDNGAWSHDGNIFYSADVEYYKTVITDGTNGWKHVEFEYTATKADSIGIWANANSNAIWFDNFSAVKGEGENIFEDGDFEGFADQISIPSYTLTGSEGLGIGDWGSGNKVITLDPTNSENAVLEGLTGFPDGWIAMALVDGTYTISFDYYFVGACDNIGFHFYDNGAWSHDGNIFYSADVEYYNTVITDGENGWKHVTATYTATNADSMGFWMNAGSNPVYLDNFSAVKEGTEENVCKVYGFDDFFSLFPGTELEEEANESGLYGKDVTLNIGEALIGANGYYGSTLSNIGSGNYQIDVAFDGEGEGDVTVEILGAEDAVLYSEKIDGDTLSKVISGIEGAVKMQVKNGKAAEISVYEFDLKSAVVKPASFDGWYASDSMTVNGDFEKFEEGLRFSNDQVEGAWGSVSDYDAPGVITTLDGSKRVQLATDGNHAYSSCFLMLPDGLEVGEVLRLTYDVKVVQPENTGITQLDTCLVGGSNTSYYLINLLQLGEDDVYTNGAEKVNYPVQFTDLGNGWYNVTIEFQLTSNDLISTNSIRWLLKSGNSEDKMYIDNVNLYELTETEPVKTVDVSSVSIAEGASLAMNVGDTKTLTASVLPENATDKSLTYKSSNEAIATVDANGKVTAVAKGACSITVTSANGKTAEIAVVVSEAAQENNNSSAKKGCGSAITATIFATVALAGCAAVIYKKREDLR